MRTLHLGLLTWRCLNEIMTMMYFSVLQFTQCILFLFLIFIGFRYNLGKFKAPSLCVYCPGIIAMAHLSVFVISYWVLFVFLFSKWYMDYNVCCDFHLWPQWFPFTRKPWWNYCRRFPLCWAVAWIQGHCIQCTPFSQRLIWFKRHKILCGLKEKYCDTCRGDLDLVH